MRPNSEVTEFVIMSGPEVHDYLVTIRGQLRAYLGAAFPQYQFSLVTQECEGMGFIVVPVVGAIERDEVIDMKEPDYMAITEIKMALEAFRPSASTLH